MPFTRHNDSVLCCSIDNHNRLAVSGGIDDTAFVWDLNTKHVIFECLGHSESVVAASFSANSTYVATGDLNGYIQVRNTTTGIKVFDYEIDEINWILWHNTSEFVLLAGTTKGDFWMWNVNDPAAVKTFPSYGSSSTSAKLLPDGMRIVVTYHDGSVRMFDLKTRQTVLQLETPNKAEIICMDLNHNHTILAIGCIDSTVKLITMSNFKVIGTLQCKSPQATSTLATTSDGGGDNEGGTSTSANPAIKQESEPMDHSDAVLTRELDQGGDMNGNEEDTPINTEPIEVIDEFTGTQETKAEDKAGDGNDGDGDEDDEDLDEYYSNVGPADEESVESVLFDRSGSFLAAASNSGSIFIWDVASQTVRVERHTGVGITRCAWTKECRYVTGCLDGVVRIYDLNLNPLEEVNAHRDQILDVAYKDGILVTGSEDKTCRVTRV